MKPLHLSITLGLGEVWSTWSWYLGRHDDDEEPEAEEQEETIENTGDTILSGDAGLAQPGTVQLGFRPM